MTMMEVQKRKMLLVALVVLFSLALPAFPQVKQPRPLTPDDLLNLEEVGQAALSPDGQWLAYTVRRPRVRQHHPALPFLGYNDRSDIWLVATSGGQPQNLTNGASDSSGWWSPAWSPDSQRLALLSTRGGNVRLWVWEKASRRLKQLTERGVDLLTGDSGPFAWLNNQQLVCPVLPEGQKPNPMTLETRAAETAMREWPKAWRGEEPTASVLESGAPMPLERRPPGQLLLIDVTKGNQPLASAYSFRELRLSPDLQHMAALKQVDLVRPDPNKLLTHGRPPVIYQAAALNRHGKPALTDLAKVKDVQPGSLRWSPDSKRLALIGRISSVNSQAVVCALSTGACQPVPGDDLEPTTIAWSARGSLLVMPRPKPNSRPDWWAFEASGQKRNLTAKMKTAPRELVREAGGESFVGLADGDLWRIHLDGGEAQNLTTNFELRIISLIWPTPSASETDAVTQVLLSVRQGTQTDWHRLDLSTDQLSLLARPHAQATLLNFNPQHQTAVFTANDRTGTYLWLARAPFAQFTAIVETNTSLREMAQAEFKGIEYRSLDGQPLKGWVMLPIGYQEGTRYPLVTLVYAGTVFGDNPPGMARSINQSSSLNYQLLAAHGYAVLFPSMPLKPEGEASDPYLELTKGVLPAVDKVIELGIADPKRLGVLGQSYGGYSTYGLITQTNRFQAAVSLAGLSDLVSLYGVFDARFRYDEFPHERVFSMSLAETGQVRMGNPLWKDFGRYLRNSPLFYVERIETPLMIVQGDLDFVAMQQGEQIFTALYRQNKRAEFVRYWGEGHVLESAANIRDLWTRIYGWLDQFLKPAGEQANAKLDHATFQQLAQSLTTQTQATNPVKDADRLPPTIESQSRDKMQKPDEVLQAMRLQPGQVIVDIGAGDGYFTRRFAVAVGDAGKAIGVDIDSAAVRKMTADAKRRGLANYEARLVPTDDPLLPPNSVDVIFLCDAYHEIADRVAYFTRIKAALRAGGRLVIIDFVKTPENAEHSSRKEDVVSELQQAGYRLTKEFDLLLPKQLFLEFTAAPSQNQPPKNQPPS